MDNAIIIAMVGSSAFTVVVNAIIELLKNIFGNKSRTSKAINFCLLYSIQNYGKELLDKGVIYAEEYKQFCEMYHTYKALGGNGYIDRLKEEVDKKIEL